VDHICEHGKSVTKIGIAYVYCEYHSQEQQTALGLIRSIIRQLVERDLSPEENSSLCRARKFLQKGHETKPPTLKDYCSLLTSIMGRFNKTVVVVDALDECAVHINSLPNRKAFVEALSALPKLKLFITSRDLPAIRDLLPQATELPIHSDHDDVMSYLDWRIEESVKLSSYIEKKPPLKAKIVDAVEKKYSNMYVTDASLQSLYCSFNGLIYGLVSF
jgi:hypothetical protein